MSEVIEKEKELAVLPELSIQIIGEVKGSNLVEYKATALEFIGSINEELKTDEDFLQADRAIKFCDKAEKELQLVKNKALSETADIEILFKTVDELTASMRAKRLTLNKLVESQKKAVRTKILNDAVKALDDYVAVIYKDIKPLSFPHLGADFDKAMKGKSAVKSMKAAVNKELKAATDKADEYQKHIKFNLTTLNELAAEHKFLFNDLNQIALNEHDYFELIVTTRVNEWNVKEKARTDKIKKDAEEAAQKKVNDAAEAKRLEDEAAEAEVVEVDEVEVSEKAQIQEVEEPTSEIVEESNPEPEKVVSSSRSFSGGGRCTGKTINEPARTNTVSPEDASKINKAAIDKEIIDGYCGWGIKREVVESFVKITAKGVIPHITINY